MRRWTSEYPQYFEDTKQYGTTMSQTYAVPAGDIIACVERSDSEARRRTPVSCLSIPSLARRARRHAPACRQRYVMRVPACVQSCYTACRTNSYAVAATDGLLDHAEDILDSLHSATTLAGAQRSLSTMMAVFHDSQARTSGTRVRIWQTRPLLWLTRVALSVRPNLTRCRSVSAPSRSCRMGTHTTCLRR